MSLCLTRRKGDVAILTLNRPEKGNSLTGELLAELCEQLKTFSSDVSIKVIALTGTGDRFFCTGADLDELKKGTNKVTFFNRFTESLDLLGTAAPLTATLVNGDCIGGGLGMALSTDFVLASSHARFGTPEITKGLFPFIISRPLLKKLGEHRAKALCFGGRLWSAEEARQYGAVSEVIPQANFGSRSEDLIGLWNQVALRTLRRGKEAMSGDSLDPNILVQYLADAAADFGRKRS